MSPQNHIGQDVKAVEFVKQVDEGGAIWFKNVPVGYIVRFSTRSSTYDFDPHTKRMRGGVIGDEWVAGEVAGSTFGGTMLAIGRLIPGALAEFYAPTMVTTSPIESVRVVTA